MRKFGLIGRVLSHSFSQQYFTQKFSREGLSAECEYSLYELEMVDLLPALLKNNPELVGLNVTIPYKKQVIPYLNSLSEEAALVGAVNCIKINSDGTLVGYNTDVDGVRFSLDKLLGDTAVASALVLGSGGAAQAVCYVLRERSIEPCVVSRQAGKGDICYDELTQEIMASNRLIINATPVGTFPHIDECPAIPYDHITPSHFLFDLVYNPSQTEFLRRGLSKGAHTLSGIDMLYAQADKAWDIWCR